MPDDPRSFLPLRPVELEILLALADEPRHGYGIMQAAAARSGGAVEIEPGTLYRALSRLRKAGVLDERARHTPGDDERRRYYRLTDLGRQVMRAEIRRLADIVAAAGGRRLLTER
jgi:DNA-binding PadR family transcriptional regulator